MEDQLIVQPKSRQGTNIENFQLTIQRTKKYRNVMKLTAVIAFLSLGAFYFGLSLAYLSSVSQPTLQKYFNISKENINTTTGYLIGCLPIGAIFGALSAPLTMTFLSRKNFLLAMNVVGIILAGIVQINNLTLLYFIRIIQGFLIGNYMAITPIYINQLVPVDVQGIFGAFTNISICTGIVFCYLIGLIFSVTNLSQNLSWRILFSLPGLFLIIQSILLIINFIPQSPVSLAENGKIQQTKKVILMFNVPQVLDKVLTQAISRGSPNKNQNNLNSQISTQKQQVKIKQSYKIPIIPKAIFLGFQLPFMQQMCGINTVNTEIGIIVGKFDHDLALYTPLIATFVQMVAAYTSTAALAYFNRRTLILFGNFSLGIIDVLIGVLFLIVATTGWNQAIYIIIALIIIYMFVFGMTIGPIVWLYVPQIIPARFVPPATALNWTGCAICILVTPLLSQAVGSPYPVFFMFGGISLVFSVINYFLVVETKGLSLVEISKKMQN